MTDRTDRQPITGNTLYYGDNLKILREYIPSESVDLIYLDPPFNSNRFLQSAGESTPYIPGIEVWLIPIKKAMKTTIGSKANKINMTTEKAIHPQLSPLPDSL